MTRLRSLFDTAVRLPAAERDAFVERECGDSLDLRERVCALLAAHGRADFLERPIVALPHERIGPYRLLEHIGEGGMGDVFLAEQDEPVQRRVAIKILKLGMNTRAVLHRFRQEYQVLSMLEHPNIARVFDAGATDDGRPFFVMECVRGPALTRYCDDHELSLRARIRLFLDVCRAVQHAHQKGIIHRDLKPTNVLVAEHERGGTPKVIDFGIAKAVAGPQTAATAHTGIGELVGTPDYMSPEQADPDEADVDTRADVYSLGVVLHELIAGHRPGALPNQDATTIARGRRTDPRSLARAMRGDLDWIVRRCLERDRELRYASVAGLAADLQRHLDDEPVLAGPPTPVYRLRKALRKHRRIAAMAVTSGLVVLSLLLWALVEKARSDASSREARAALGRARTMTRFLSETLASADPHVARGMDTALLMRLTDDASGRIRDGELASEPAAEAGLRLVLADVYYALSAFDDQAAILAPIERLLRDAGHADRDSLLRADALQRLARVHVESDAARALRCYDEAIAIRRRLGGDDRALARCLLYRANVLHRLGRAHEMLATADRAMVVVQRSGAEPQLLAHALRTRSQALRRLGRPGDALPVGQRALAIAREHLDRNSLGSLLAHLELGYALLGLGRSDESLRHFEAGLVIARRVHSGPHHIDASLLLGKAGALQGLGRPEAALEPVRQALAMQRSLHGEQTGRVAMTTLSYSQALSAVGRNDDAIAECERALAVLRGLHDGPDHDLGAAQSVHARLLLATGRFDEALRSAEEAVDVWHATLDGAHAQVAAALQIAGRACIELGDYAGAIGRFRAATEEADRAAGKPSPTGTAALTRTADALWRLQRFDEAEACYDEAGERAASLGDRSQFELDRLAVGRTGMLVAQRRFAEAEALLDGIEARHMDGAARPLARRAYVDARVQLYEAWQRPQAAAEWRTHRDR